MQARQIRRATASNPSQIQPAARSTSPIIFHLLQPATSPPPSELAGETATASDSKSLILLASASSSHAVRLRPFQPDLATARARGLISSRTHQRTTASNASFHQCLPDASIATSGSSSSHCHDHDPFRRRSGLHDAPQLPLSNDGRLSDARPPSPHPPATIQPANLLTHQQINGPDSDLGSSSPICQIASIKGVGSFGDDHTETQRSKGEQGRGEKALEGGKQGRVAFVHDQHFVSSIT
ncbi:hypothetical protein ACLOJK_035744 [Asimina triloba]